MVRSARERLQTAESDSSRTDHAGRREWVWAVLVAAVAVVLRVYALTRDPLWYDEVMHLRIARDLSWHTLSCRDALIEPWFCIFLSLWIRISTADLWIRLYAVLFGLATVAVAYAFGRRLSGPRGGHLAALFAALSPLLVFYSRDVKMYPMVTFFELSVAYLALVYASADGRPRHLVAYSVLAVLLLHTHLVAPMYMAALNAMYLMLRARSVKKTLYWLAAQALVVLAMGPYLYAERRFAKIVAGTFFFAPPPTPRSLWVTAGNLLVGYATQPWVRLAAIVLFAVLLTLALLVLRGKRSEAVFLLGVAAGHVAALYAFSLWASNSYYVDRYLVGSAAPLLVVAGAGLARLRCAWLRLPLAALPVVLFGFGLHDFYAYRFTPDVREHLAVYRTSDTRGLRDAIRRDARPGDVVWHVTFSELIPLRWYVPELPHVLIDMGGRADSTLNLMLPDCGRDFYGNHPVEVEAVRPEAGRVWLVIPEGSTGLFAQYGGFLAWVAARASCLSHAYFGGRYAPVSLYLFDFSAPPEGDQPNSTAPIPPERSEEIAERRQEFRLMAQRTDPAGPVVFSVENASDRECNASYVVTQTSALCAAPAFDRRLTTRSRWSVQVYRDRFSARMACHDPITPRSDREDVLFQTVTLDAGRYNMLVERTQEGADYPIPTAGMTVSMAGQTFPVAAKAEGHPGGWQWVYAGTVELDRPGPVAIELAPCLPEDRPEEMATFSNVALVAADRARTPVLRRGSVTLEPGEREAIEVTPRESKGRIDFVLAAPDSSASVWLHLAPAP